MLRTNQHADKQAAQENKPQSLDWISAQNTVRSGAYLLLIWPNPRRRLLDCIVIQMRSLTGDFHERPGSDSSSASVHRHRAPHIKRFLG